MNSTKLVRVISIPLFLELVNRGVHALYRDASIAEKLQKSDIVTICITVVVLMFLGWRVATIYSERRLLRAAGLGLLLWFISTVVITGGATLASSTFGTLSTDSVVGPLIAFALFAPVAALAPLVGVLLRALR